MKNKFAKFLLVGAIPTCALLSISIPVSAASFTYIDTTLMGESTINNTNVVVSSVADPVTNATNISTYDISTGAISVIYSADAFINNLVTNNRGDVVWSQSPTDPIFSNSSIMYYRGQSPVIDIFQISNPATTAHSPRLNNRGEAVWTEPDSVTPSRSYFYDPVSGMSTRLTAGPILNGLAANEEGVRINDNGSVIWGAFALLSTTSISSEVIFQQSLLVPPTAASSPTTPASYTFGGDINNSDVIVYGRMEPAADSFVGPCRIEKRDSKGNLITDPTGVPVPPVINFTTCPGGTISTSILDNGNVLYFIEDNFQLNSLYLHDAATGINALLASNVNIFAYNKAGTIVWTIHDGNPVVGLFYRDAISGKVSQMTTGFTTLGGINDKGDIVFRDGATNSVRVAVNTTPPVTPPPPKPPEPPKPPAPPKPPEPPLPPKPPENLPLLLSVNSMDLDLDKAIFDADIDYDLGTVGVSPTHEVSLTIDGVNLFKESLSVMDVDEGEYTLDTGDIIFTLDTDKSNINIELANIVTTGIDPSDGLAVQISIGKALGKTTYIVDNNDD